MTGGSPRRVSIGRWTERSQRPVYALDRSRVLVYANAACLEWLGAEEANVLGRKCDFHSLMSRDSTMDVVAGLCPPPDQLEVSNGTFIAWHLQSDGASRQRQAHCWQMGGEETFDWTLVLLGDPVAPDVEITAGTTDPKQLHLALVEAHRSWGRGVPLDDLVGTSASVQRVRRQIELAASQSVNVVIHGMPGTGRERVARTIHQLRGGVSSPTTLIPLDCHLLDAELLQGTVVGFIRSASELTETGAATLLLLDVDGLQPAAQAVLVEILNVEALALKTLATSSMLLLQNENFRSDLASILSTLPIELPPLSQRLEDLPLLVQSAVEAANSVGRHQITGVTPEALDALWAHPWRRNLDELWEIVAEAHQRCRRTLIGVEDLPDIIRLTADAENYPPMVEETVMLEAYLLEMERKLLLRTLEQCQGNRAKAARRLGISRAKFLRRLQVVQGMLSNERDEDVGLDEP